MSLRNVRYQYLVAVAFVFGTFMDILDTTIINVAIPQLRAHFGVGRTTIEWVITGYLCSLAVWIPAAGWIGDRYGTKKTFLFALAMFTGASRALLASVIFAFETTRQPLGLLPLLGGCSAAFLISCLFMRNTIMTEKIVRRGVRVPGEYAADFLDQIQAGTAASRPVVSLPSGELLEAVRSRIAARAPGYAHQGFPVVDGDGQLEGVLTRRDLLDPEQPGSRRVGELLRRPTAVAYEDSTLREAADHMVREGVGRLPVVARDEPRKVVGMLTRSDLLSAHRQRLEESDLAEQHLDLGAKLRRRNGTA